MEAAVSWEGAVATPSGLPSPIVQLFQNSNRYREPVLLFAVAEHKVPLAGQGPDSQSDVWALIRTSAGTLSMTVEAKAKETFGENTLQEWLVAREGRDSGPNRQKRWDYIREHLPEPTESFMQVRYQILHRCAASVIEARRFGLQHAAFIVQAFQAPARSFNEYGTFCKALGIPAARGTITEGPSVDGVSLSVGWTDCQSATDTEMARTV